MSNIKYVLEDLLKVREFRQDAAAKEVTVAQYKLEEAEKLIHQKIKEKDEYLTWRKQREDQLYADIKGKNVSLRDLDDLKARIYMLRQRDLAFEKAIEDAKRAKQEAETKLEEAREAHKAAAKDRQKIEEHKKIWMEEAQLEEAEKEEKEMEDFQVKKKGFEDEDEDDDRPRNSDDREE